MVIRRPYSFFRDVAPLRSFEQALDATRKGFMILYASRGGSAKQVALDLGKQLHFETLSLENFNFDDIYSNLTIMFVVASDGDGTPVPDGKLFFRLLEDLVQDFRVDRIALEKLNFAVVGIGSVEYGMDNFCIAAKRMDEWLYSLGANRVAPCMLVTDTESLSDQALFCSGMISASIEQMSSVKSGRTVLHAWRDDFIEDSVSQSDGVESSDDIEEIAEDGCITTPSKDMLTDRQRAQLEKEGYKIIGSHSAVKLCRWTKHHTRGRGGCYKHTFYGISSMNCMEATPSLACANKCVFCWRHHKNPVGTSWKWNMDPADEIVQEAVRLHTNLIKQLKGVPGVTEETHKSAMTVKHCALSLVGEPIMYPQINELILELHARRISTFLVTNAQFPGAIKTLKPVTQLYVSVDAGSKEVLKKTDRPLFQDFWERYIDSFKAIGDVTQRTVYRLTLVKQYNMTEDSKMIQEYADLIALGNPDFIEIKAVTFCGSNENDKDNLTMQNVPWHEEVLLFSQALCQSVNDRYSIACEHKHSCSVLIALNKYNVNGQWHTWIDYEKFADLALSGRPNFHPEEYWAPTPDWAVYGAEERGFDPEQTRHHRNAKSQNALTD